MTYSRGSMHRALQSVLSMEEKKRVRVRVCQLDMDMDMGLRMRTQSRYGAEV